MYARKGFPGRYGPPPARYTQVPPLHVVLQGSQNLPVFPVNEDLGVPDALRSPNLPLHVGLSLCPSNEDSAVSSIRRYQHLFSHYSLRCPFSSRASTRVCQALRGRKKPFSHPNIGQIREYAFFFLSRFCILVVQCFSIMACVGFPFLGA